MHLCTCLFACAQYTHTKKKSASTAQLNLKLVWDILSQILFCLALFEINRDEIVSHWLYVNCLAIAIIPLSEENVTLMPPVGK